MYKLMYTHFTKLIINYIVSHNKSIPRRSDSKLHSSQDDQPITKLLSTTNGEYKFGMEIPDAMISDAIKKKVEYTYYMAKKVEMNAPNKLKKNVVSRKTISLTIAEEAVVENANETDDADESNMDLSNDNPHEDDDVSSAGLIQTLLDETPANELMDFMSHPVYTDAHTTSVVHIPEGNPELISYILGATEVPLGTHVDVLATKTLMQEIFPDENAHHIPSLPGKKIPYPTTTPQPNSLQAKAKKLMQKAKKIMRKINFKKAVVQKFREYDQKLEALINFNVSKAFEKAVQAKVLTEIKKRLPTHIPNAITNYVKPRLNTSMLEVMKTNKINLFTQSSTSTEDLYGSKNEAKSDIDKDENHIIGPSTVAITKKFKELIQKDELTIANLEGARLERLKVQYNNDVELEYHVSQLKAAVLSEAHDYTYHVDLSTKEKYTTSITKHYFARYYKEGIEDRIPERWSKEVRHYHFEALNCIHNWEEDRIDFFKAGMSVVAEGNVYSDLRVKLVVRIVVKKKWGYGFLTSIVVRRSNDKEYEFSYAYLPRLSVNDVEDMYLLQLSEVKKFCDGTLVKIQENLIDMLSKNKLGSGNKRLKGRDWTDYDVKSSKEMRKKDEILRHREQLRRLEEYVRGRPKTVNPRMVTGRSDVSLALAALSYRTQPKSNAVEASNRSKFEDTLQNEFQLKREAAQSAYEVAKEKDPTIMKLKEIKFLAVSTKDLPDDDAHFINMQKEEIKKIYGLSRN
ncbi:hypothetical protein Tco_1438124 [Tanacetum coccineum]